MAKRKKKSNKTLYILLGAVGLLIVSLIVGKSAGLIGKDKEIDVTTAKVTEVTIVEKVSASGNVRPVNEVNIAPDVSGEIIELTVEEGDSVTIGDLLVKIRPENFVNALERAEANYNTQRANLASTRASLARSEATFERVKTDYARSKKLYDEKVISDAEWQLAEQNHKVAINDLESAGQSVKASEYIVLSSKASVDDAKENLRLTSVYAPATGTVSKLLVEKGERVVGANQFAGTEMLRIADLKKMEVRVDVNENDIIRISVRDTAIIDVDSYTYMDKTFLGLVTHIANTAKDQVSQDAVTEFEVRIRILNSSFEDLIKEGNATPFRPGMSASVEIITSRKDNVVSVPLSAVTTRKQSEIEEDSTKTERRSEIEDEGTSKDEEKKEVVFVNDNGVAKIVQVKTGISDYDNIEILEGLTVGDEIVSGPFLAVSRRLKNGDLIKTDDKNKKDEEEDEEEESDDEE